MRSSTQPAGRSRYRRLRPALVMLPLAAMIAACGGSDDDDDDNGGSADLNARSAFVRGDIARTEYDGNADDLLTAEER